MYMCVYQVKCVEYVKLHVIYIYITIHIHIYIYIYVNSHLYQTYIIEICGYIYTVI